MAAISSVVIVDPSADCLKRGCDLLQQLGYETYGFASSDRALAYCQRHPIDMVIADFFFVKPKLSKWKKAFPKPRFVFVVRSRSPEVMAECFRQGATDCVVKPLDKGDLSEMLGRTLPRSSAGVLVEA